MKETKKQQQKPGIIVPNMNILGQMKEEFAPRAQPTDGSDRL